MGKRRPSDPPPVKCSARSRVRDADGNVVRDAEGYALLKPCGNYAIRGGTVCDVHGGRNPVAWDAARNRLVEGVVFSKMADMLAECNLEEHPLDGILDGVRRSGAMVRVLGLMVGELSTMRRPEYAAAAGDENLGLYGPNHLGDGAPHVLLTMYANWLDRHARICELALKADIDERVVRQYENQANVLEQAVMAAIAKVGMTGEQQTAFKVALAGELRDLLGAPQLATVSSIV